MKRTLLEILAGTAVLVLLLSFNHRISRMDAKADDVASLRQLVQEKIGEIDHAKAQNTSKDALISHLDSRIGELEQQLAASDAEDARQLREELAATRRDADRFRAEIARDVTRTKELVDAYHKEFTALDRRAMESFGKAQEHLKSLTDSLIPDPATLSRDLLSPTVQLNGDDTVGSGTLVNSIHDPARDEYDTYVLTSYHVVRNIVADSPAAKESGVSITVYGDNGLIEVRGDMICFNAKIDAALIKLRTTQPFDNLARVVARDDTGKIRVWQGVYAVGCPLGNDPIPTRGEISSKQNELKGSNYWMINAPTYFGNSGGGVYLAGSRELVGVFSKIYTHGRGNPIVVPHMGLCTPIDLIYTWLDEENYAYVLEPHESRIDPSQLAAPGK